MCAIWYKGFHMSRDPDITQDSHFWASWQVFLPPTVNHSFWKPPKNAERDIGYDYNIMMRSIFHGWHFALDALHENLFFFSTTYESRLWKHAEERRQHNKRDVTRETDMLHAHWVAEPWEQNINIIFFFFHKDGNMSWKKGDHHMS